MPEYCNAAGRLLTIFEKLVPKSGQGMQFKDVYVAFDCQPDPQSMLRTYSDLSAEYVTLVAEIEQVKENPHKYELYKKNLPDILETINSFHFSMPGEGVTFAVNPKGLVALQFIAADLVQEEAASEDELATLRRLVTELQEEIEQSTTLRGKMKEWLLDLVRTIRDSLDRYRIRGSRGMRKQFALLLGELMVNYDLSQEAKADAPSIWGKITSAIDIMNNVASLAEKSRPAIEMGAKVLTYVKQLCLPSP